MHEIVENATSRLPLSHSSNGGPPRPARGPSPVLVLALAFVVGVTAARFLTWRAHAHPRD